MGLIVDMFVLYHNFKRLFDNKLSNWYIVANKT